MIALGIETATTEVGAALAGPDGLLASFVVRTARQHAELLHLGIDQVCRASRVSLDEVGAIGVDIGPGMFTGIRVGIAAAKGLGFSLGIDVVGLRGTDVLARAVGQVIGARGPSLESLGQPENARASLEIVSVLDVRRQEVAWGPGVTRLGKIDSFVDDLLVRLENGSGQILLVGSGARRYETAIRAELLAKAAEKNVWPEQESAPMSVANMVTFAQDISAPPVGVLAEIARQSALAGEAASPFLVEALYLRDADAADPLWPGRDPVGQVASKQES